MTNRIPWKRETFGRLQKSEQAAKRLRGLATAHGWDELQVERIDFGHGVVRWALTGVPTMRRIYEFTGRNKHGVNNPRFTNPKRRKGQDYRHGE